MRHIYILFLFIAGLAYSQIPSNYYDSANGLSGYALKTQLKNIVTSGHTYNASSYDNLFTAYASTDRDYYYENDGSLLDIYSENPTGSETSYNIPNDECGGNITGEGQCYNREHLFPQGFFNNSDALPMVSDIHTVVPTDGFVNNGRSNYPFGIVSNTNTSYANGSKWGTGNNYGYTNRVFEPIDEFKGDIARAMLYFAVRYEDNWNDSGWEAPDASPYNPLNGTSDQFYETWFINTMLDWHAADPVSQRELDRNDEAYNFQGNANPFVNHPEYAALIWNPVPDTQAPSDPTNLVASNPTDNSINLSWTASTDNVSVTSYDIYQSGVNLYNTVTTSFVVTGLSANTNYCFTVRANDGSGNTSGFSNQACETTSDNGSQTTDLFISEYVEGSATNKAIEIANFTGGPISLLNYTLKLATNSNNFSTTYTFPNSPTIANGDVFVVANSGLNSGCQSEQDDVNNSITGFNGNDVIGLFKNNILIDILGIEGDDSDFAKNVTLIRKPEIQFPSTTYDANEWNVESIDDCSDLGQHNQILSTIDNSMTSISIFPNPINSVLNVNLKFDRTTQIDIYDVMGKKVFTTTINSSKRIQLRELRSGIYIIKLKQDNASLTKRLIKN
ncbi:endonuclease [Winogradskyella sp.]|uniref:endonuclease n=1 Tax=Winogradskyella sp. TaxID=1883156 RepID=UPI003F6A2E4C